MTTTLKGGEAGRHPSQPSEPAAAAPHRRYETVTIPLWDFPDYCREKRLEPERIYWDEDGNCHAILRKKNLRSIRVENGSL